jgi:hypothetical protein
LETCNHLQNDMEFQVMLLYPIPSCARVWTPIVDANWGCIFQGTLRKIKKAYAFNLQQ